MARRVGFSEGEPPRRKRRTVPIVLLTLWLIGWTAGIAFVLNALLGALEAEGTGPPLVLIGWLVVATVGWVFGARLLMRLARGAPRRRAHTRRDPQAFPTERRREPGESGDR